MSSITFKIVGPSLTENGSNGLRTTFGGFYETVEAEDGQVSLEYVSSEGGQMQSSTKVDYPDHEFVSKSRMFNDNVVTASNKVILPSYRVPGVLIGYPFAVKNDEHWKSILRGTSYDTSSYEPILRVGVEEDNVLSLDMPYDLLSLKKLVGSSYGDYEYLTQGYTYNYFHKPYETRIEGAHSDVIPNLYLLNAAYLEQSSSFDIGLINLINLEGETGANSYEMDTLFDEVLFKYPPPAGGGSETETTSKNRFWDEQSQYKAYLDLYVDTVFSGSTSLEASKLRNIIFDRDFLDLEDGVNFKSLPYYMDMSWPRSDQGAIGERLVEHRCEALFMKMIKKEFVDNRSAQRRMATRTQITSVSASATSTDELNSIGTPSYLMFDLLPQCLNYIKTFDQTAANFTFLNHDMLEKKILTDQSGIYRHIKKSRMMNFFTEMVDYVDTTYSRQTYLQTNGYDGSLSGIFDNAQSAKTSEVLGYRIEKIGGTPVGEARSLQVLANYYIFNAGTDGTTGLPTSVDDDKFHFYDTQVKYGQDYKYNIYQYVAVVGYRSRYSNPQISRQIGTTDTTGDGKGDTFCLEFYSDGGQASTWDRPDGGNVFTLLSGSGTDQNPYATSAQVLTKQQYLAMFEYTIEPYVRIVEIPLGSKRLSVFDHPPRAVEIIPYQKKDDSQTIGFYAKYESFVKQPYPTTIGPIENQFRTTYLDVNNLLETEDISHSSTKPTMLQVFRITEKPTSYNDFANNLVATKPLRDAIFKFPFTNCLYEERIQTNQKYYYVFRFLNQHFMPGHLSPVVEVELVSDGGYKYTLFDIIGPSHITDVISVDEPSKAFKKLLKLVPAPTQIIIDDSNVDYEEAAADQISNLVIGSASEKIWDKTFKVRLTSKKTGKKIDVNVTYNLTSE